MDSVFQHPIQTHFVIDPQTSSTVLDSLHGPLQFQQPSPLNKRTVSYVSCVCTVFDHFLLVLGPDSPLLTRLPNQVWERRT
jgi:hypothetical protein